MVRPLVAVLAMALVACWNENPVAPGDSRDTERVMVDDVRVTHECGDVFVLRNDLPGPDSTTLFRWKARQGSWNGPVLATDTVRIANRIDGVTSYARVAIPDTADLISVHLVVASPDSIYHKGSGSRGWAALPSCTQRIPFHLLVGEGATLAAPPLDSLLIGSQLYWSAQVDDADTLAVDLNGSPVARTGSVTVDSSWSRVLLTAVGVWYPEPLLTESQAFIAQMRAIAGSGDPGAAAEALLTDMLDFALAEDSALVDSVFNQVARRAFDLDTEVSLMFQLDSALHGRMLRIEPTIPPAGRMRRSGELGEPTEVVLVNGIHTPSEEFRALVEVARQFIGGPALQLTGFWNPSMNTFGPEERCFTEVRKARSDAEAHNAMLRFCRPVYVGPLDGIDVLEALQQIVAHYVPFASAPRQISLDLADSVAALHQFGNHVILMGHSQGMMVVKEAVEELVTSNRYSQTRDSTCLGALVMGGPVAGGWWLSSHYIDEFAATGDIVSATVPGIDRVYTSLSAELDTANVGKSWFGRYLNNVRYGIRIHDLRRSYFRDSATLDRILGSLDRIRKECEFKEVVNTMSSPPTFYRGDEFWPHLYFQIRNHNGRRLYGRTLDSLESSDSSVMSFLANPNRRAVAVGHGTATIFGTYRSEIGEMPVSVAAVPDLGAGGSRGGQWLITSPYIADTLALSGLTYMDLVTANGEYLLSGGTVYYMHNGTPYTVPVTNARITPTGTPAIRFTMATPEFPNPYSYAEVTLYISSNGSLSGGAILYHYPGLVRESRGWTLGAP